jgi:hypothetical protein
MVTQILDLPLVASNKGPVVIAIPKIENRTLSTDFDSYSLIGKIRQQLRDQSDGRLILLDEEAFKEFLAVRGTNHVKQVNSPDTGEVVGLDYLLTGDASSLRIPSPNGALRERRFFSFRLTDSEDGKVVWEQSYEFKKVSQRGNAYR